MSLACYGISTEGFSGSASQINVASSPWPAVLDLETSARIHCIPQSEQVTVGLESILARSPRGWVQEYLNQDWTYRQEHILKRMDSFGPHAVLILGSNATDRLEEFKNYDHGWDSGKGEPLSQISIAFVDTFANKYSELRNRVPSLFLTREGNLQLSWEDEDGQPVEVEFFPDRLEYYVGRTEEEGAINIDPENPTEAFQQLIKIIS
ncbi:MAG: hypothetical protein WAW37_17255 [Syntrophobacteraceae bacterium]